MDSTPIYDELQKTLIDPESSDWDTSTPPEFASSIEATGEHAEDAATNSESADEPRQRHTNHGAGSRHRAED